MVVVSTRDFRANQTKYLNMARRGEQVMLHSRRSGRFMLEPMPQEDEADVITPELQAAIDEAMKEHREGKCITLRSHEDIERYFAEL